MLLRLREIADAVLTRGADLVASTANRESRKSVYVERRLVCWKTNSDYVVEAAIALIDWLNDDRVRAEAGWSAVDAIAPPGLPFPDTGLGLFEGERRGEWNEKCHDWPAAVFDWHERGRAGTCFDA